MAATVLVVGAAAVAFLIHTEQTGAAARQAMRQFDQQARETVETIGELRAAEQAYVAEGQGLDFWSAKSAQLLETAQASVDAMSRTAQSPDGTAALTAASTAVKDLAEIDHRARGYLERDQRLMASDVIFTEGGTTAAAGTHQVEAARLAERRLADESEAAARRLEAYVVGGAAVYCILLTLLLAFAGGSTTIQDAPPLLKPDDALPAAPPSRPDPNALPEVMVPLRTAADLCTEFGQVSNRDDLARLLGRAADSLNATGVIVWVGSPEGDDLRPALAHGYPQQALARMKISRSADNAAAAAYRTGAYQVVKGTPSASGAVVAPLLVPGGCIGALTAEVRDGAENTDAVRALSTIFAAQLSGLLASPAAVDGAGAAPRSAAG